jgi:Fe-S-cluster-containing dehydrogenase component
VEIVEEPATYHLVADYHIRVNILRASIDPEVGGQMVVDLSGDKRQLAEGLNYLERVGVSVEPLAQQIAHRDERCTSCTACIPHCPTQALNVNRESMSVSFDAQQCIVCLSCLDVCIYKAIVATERLM